MRTDILKLLAGFLGVIVALLLLPGSFDATQATFSRLQYEEGVLESELMSFRGDYADINGKITELESTIFGDTPRFSGEASSSFSTIAPTACSVATVYSSRGHTGRFIKMGHRGAKTRLTILSAERDKIAMQVSALERKLSDVEEKINSHESLLGVNYRNLLRAKKFIKELPLNISGTGVSEEMASVPEIVTPAVQIEAYEEQLSLAISEYQALVLKVKELEGKGRKLLAEQAALEKELPLLNKRAEALSAKLNGGEGELGQAALDNAKEEFDLCAGSMRTVQQRLGSVGSKLDVLRNEFDGLVAKASAQKAVVELMKRQ